MQCQFGGKFVTFTNANFLVAIGLENKGEVRDPQNQAREF